MQNDPRYINDIKTAKDALRPIVLRLKGLIQAWGIFHSTDELTTAFEGSYDNLSWQTKMAFSKAIVAEYIKPWQSHNGKALSSLQTKGKINFLDNVIKRSPIHNALNELRQQSVAHAHESFEALHINILGNEVLNSPHSGERQANTLEKVFVPMAPELSIERGLWWINNLKTLVEVKNLAQSCKKATKDEITNDVATLRDNCFEYMHVLHELSDLFSLEQIQPNGIDTNGNPNFDFKFSDKPSGNIKLRKLKSTRIGDANISSGIILYQPKPTLQSNIEIKGRGYHLRMSLDKKSNNMTFNMSFPVYPFPDESP